MSELRMEYPNVNGEFIIYEHLHFSAQRQDVAEFFGSCYHVFLPTGGYPIATVASDGSYWYSAPDGEEWEPHEFTLGETRDIAAFMESLSQHRES